MIKADWIAVDWGTSNLRAWAMSNECEVLGERRSELGMSKLAYDEFEPALIDLISDWLSDAPIDVLACGMVGSRQGWVEAPYVATPCKASTELTAVPTKDPHLKVKVLAGVKQFDPADVMRGEETQIAGYLLGRPDFDGVICLPGTHSKWARVQEGKIKEFQTVMTGELFALLSKQSLLQHSLGEWDDDVFVRLSSHCLAHPEDALAQLFKIRASSLLNGCNNGVAKLSGTLIGSELAGTRSIWQDQEIVVVGMGELAGHYVRALTHVGAKATAHKASNMTQLGLSLAYKEMKNG